MGCSAGVYHGCGTRQDREAQHKSVEAILAEATQQVEQGPDRQAGLEILLWWGAVRAVMHCLQGVNLQSQPIRALHDC